MFNFEKCGSVTGAYVVLGLAFGHCKDNDFEQKKYTCRKIEGI